MSVTKRGKTHHPYDAKLKRRIQRRSKRPNVQRPPMSDYLMTPEECRAFMDEGHGPVTKSEAPGAEGLTSTSAHERDVV